MDMQLASFYVLRGFDLETVLNWTTAEKIVHTAIKDKYYENLSKIISSLNKEV